MNYCEWADQKVKKFGLWDYGFVKLAVVAFTLLIAKLVDSVLSLPWYVYGIIFLLAMIKPLIRVFSNK